MSISTLPDILRHHARTSGDKQALVSAEDGRTWTFGELNAEANRVAAALTAAGVGNQDRQAELLAEGASRVVPDLRNIVSVLQSFQGVE